MYMKMIKCRYVKAETLLSSQQKQHLKGVAYNSVQVKNKEFYSPNFHTDFFIVLNHSIFTVLDEIANMPETCTTNECFTLFCHTGSSVK